MRFFEIVRFRVCGHEWPPNNCSTQVSHKFLLRIVNLSLQQFYIRMHTTAFGQEIYPDNSIGLLFEDICSLLFKNHILIVLSSDTKVYRQDHVGAPALREVISALASTALHCTLQQLEMHSCWKFHISGVLCSLTFFVPVSSSLRCDEQKCCKF